MGVRQKEKGEMRLRIGNEAGGMIWKISNCY